MAKTNQPTESGEGEWLEEYEGQLAIDVYQTEDNIIIKAPIAGVSQEDLEISVSDEVVTVKGERRETLEIARENYFTQECYWGTFSRSYVLPVAAEAEKATASLKNGVLTITIPKLEKSKTRILKINTEE